MRYRKSFSFLGRKHPVSRGERGQRVASVRPGNDIMPQLEGRGSARLRTFRQWTEGAHEPQAEEQKAWMPSVVRGRGKQQLKAGPF